MRKLTLSLLSAILFAGAAGAAEPAQPPLQEYAGRYVLSDGRILTVSEDSGTLRAAISPRNPTMDPRFSGARDVVLKPDGLGSFSSTSTPLRISFSQDAGGDVVQVNMDEHAAPMHALARR
jgi:hypothetical protein